MPPGPPGFGKGGSMKLNTAGRGGSLRLHATATATAASAASAASSRGHLLQKSAPQSQRTSLGSRPLTAGAYCASSASDSRFFSDSAGACPVHCGVCRSGTSARQPEASPTRGWCQPEPAFGPARPVSAAYSLAATYRSDLLWVLIAPQLILTGRWGPDLASHNIRSCKAAAAPRIRLPRSEVLINPFH